MKPHPGMVPVATLAPEVDTFLRQLEARVAQRCRGRAFVYLDTCYWVYLRSAALGQAKLEAHDRALAMLRKAVGSGRAVCPVSDVAFAELTSQEDPKTLRATCELWDELSLGVVLKPEHDRVALEIEAFFRNSAEPSAAWELGTAWTSPYCVFGTSVPFLKELSPAHSAALQAAWLERAFALSFVELVQGSSAELQLSKRSQESADRINGTMRNYQHEVKNFQGTLLSEFAGALDGHEGAFDEAILNMWATSTHATEPLVYSDVARMRTSLRTGLVNALRVRREQVARKLPTLYALGSCHAGVRLDRTRKFDGNFLRDIQHAAAGASYHDVMLTERPLKTLMTAGNIRLNETLECEVLSSPSEVLDYFGRIGWSD